MTNDAKNSISFLFEKVKVGDKNALIKLFKTVDRYVYSIAMRILVDEGLAEDVLIDTFDAFVTNINKIRKPEAVYDWLKVTARNKALSVLRKRQKELYLNRGTIEYFIDRKAGIAASLDDKLIIDEALSQLPENERTAILYKAKKYTIEEISDLLGKPIWKVRYLISTAQNKLKKYFK